MSVFLIYAVEITNGRMIMTTVDPFAAKSELEISEVGIISKRIDRIYNFLDVYTIYDFFSVCSITDPTAISKYLLNRFIEFVERSWQFGCDNHANPWMS
ncbi:MAG: hypothetical protein WBD99_10395 [Thermodesulfobacteriota bacterium]